MLLTNRSGINHFTCDVTVASFYMWLIRNFNTTSIIYPGMCVPSFVLLLLRIVEILRGRKWGQKMSSAAGRHWRIQPPVLGGGGGGNLALSPNLVYPQNWKLYGFNPLFFGMDPNSLSKKSFLGALGAKDNMTPFLGFGGHGRVGPLDPPVLAGDAEAQWSPSYKWKCKWKA